MRFLQKRRLRFIEFHLGRGLVFRRQVNHCVRHVDEFATVSVLFSRASNSLTMKISSFWPPWAVGVRLLQRRSDLYREREMKLKDIVEDVRF